MLSVTTSAWLMLLMLLQSIKQQVIDDVQMVDAAWHGGSTHRWGREGGETPSTRADKRPTTGAPLNVRVLTASLNRLEQAARCYGAIQFGMHYTALLLHY